MTKSDKHTDQIFRELNNLESQPSPHVWDEIESRLAGKGKKRRMLPFLKWTAAAVVLLAGGLLWLFNGPAELSMDKQISYFQQEGSMDDTSGSEEASQNIQRQDPIEALDKENRASGTSQGVDEKLAKRESNELSRVDDHPTRPSIIAHVRSSERVPSDNAEETALPEKLTPRATPLISDREFSPASDQLVLEPEQKPSPATTVIPSPGKHAWLIGGEYSPTYAFRDVSGPATGSSREDGMMTGGGGFSLTLRTDNRWQVETGVNYARMGQEVATVSRSDRAFGLMQADEGLDVTGVQLDNTMGVIRRENTPKQADANRTFSSSDNEIVQLSSSDMGDQPLLEQSLGYVKVPVTLRYKLFERQNIDVSLAGGFSANWLVDNDAYLRMSGERQYVGRTGGLAGASVSSHAGIGVAIPVFRQLHLRMEPRVDYFISDINESSSVRYRPYSFGVYTGVFY
ncbi:MAG: hypothetical protein ACOCPW_06305, partial [Marinilabiliaceae bacterium]